MKEKKQVNIKNPEYNVNEKTCRPYVKGVCPNDGITVYKFLSNSDVPSEFRAKIDAKIESCKKNRSTKGSEPRKSKKSKKSKKTGAGQRKSRKSQPARKSRKSRSSRK